MTANDIRQQFIDFFVKRHGHRAVPSSSVVPLDDSTLLFTNAGMNQFKDVFLGTGSRPYKRAVDTQKCIRAGGKHNDLDDVGKDTYHHTFFEMLGNWSFGDYFKKEAIQWAWELLTEVWKLDKSRLHATVFEGSPDEGVPRDDEALEFWKTLTDIDPSNIHLGNKKDNFWMMGDTGACGPCTEVHYDRTPDRSGRSLVNKGDARVIEIWNLVFIQFNRDEHGQLQPLPANHVDTGMGFERVTSVLQGKESNYDTDVFTPIFKAIQDVTKAEPYSGKLEDMKDTAYRVVADHIRTLTFALTDGAQIGNEGRNYVLKRILRRAERYGRQYLGTKEPFLCHLVPAVVEAMGHVFPELKRNPQAIADQIKQDEVSFVRTLDRGIGLFKEAAERARQGGKNQISGDDAFDLHSTYGVFIDITEQMASEVGLAVDRLGYEERMRRFQEETGGGPKGPAISAIRGELPKTDDSPKYDKLTAKAKVVGWVKENEVIAIGEIGTGEQVSVLLDRTNFYAEQGGQVGDRGTISTKTGKFAVEETKRLGDAVLHVGKVVEGTIKPGQPATLEIGGDRPHTMRNHTATHLMNWALRKVLGDHVEQKGSLVDANRTRFDFSHPKPMTADEVAEVERLVNERIYTDLPVTDSTMPLEDAKQLPGVRAVFGEKYPDPVRVLMIGPKKPQDATPEHSVEFCGGTHLSRTGEAGFFKIVSQEKIGAGIQRVTAVTGKEAVATVQRMSGVLDELTGRLNCKPEEIGQRITALQEQVKKLEQQLKKGATADLNSVGDKLLSQAVEVNGAKVIVGEVPSAHVDAVRGQVDRLRQKASSSVMVFGWIDEDKVMLLAAVTENLTKKVKAGDLVRTAAAVVGGKGGGGPTMAQASGKDRAKLPEALNTALEAAKQGLA